jgi:Periplasmic serine proteases (ClpP class)
MLTFFFGFIGAIMSSFKDTPQVTIPSNTILKIDLSTQFVDVNLINPFDGISLMGGSSEIKEPIGILSATEAIKKAANDPAIKFIYLLGNPTNTNMANLDELRKALKEFRESGKAVIAYAQNYSQGSYYVASVADKVYINNFGSSDMIGIGSNMLFFKDLLDNIGVNVQLIRHGKFKAAAEQFVESNISKENLEQNQQMISSLWNTWVDKIYESRGITPEKT